MILQLTTLLATVILTSISLTSIFLHLNNYRKPLQQRFFVRIILIIPIYSIVCYLNLRASLISVILEPIKEIYEAFVLYQFYGLLTHLLGGERSIIITASGRPPVPQIFPMKYVYGKYVDISDPETFLLVKRSILQYVWLKPFLCVSFGINEAFGDYLESSNLLLSFSFWVNVIYNALVSLLLYSLALFWTCLYKDLQPFQPWGKFLCIKLIIFASYWQGMGLAILRYFGYFSSLSFVIQNSLLCFELIGFLIGHWHAFSYHDFTIKHLGLSLRMTFIKAVKDVFGCQDLIHDFRTAFQQGSKMYNFRQFQSVEEQVSQFDSTTRLKKLNQGLRYYREGDKVTSYWINESVDDSDAESVFSGGATLVESPKASKSSTASNKGPKGKKKRVKAQLAQEKKVQDIKKKTKEVYKIQEPETAQFLADIRLSRDEFLKDNALYIKAIRERPFGDENYPVIHDEFGYIYSRDLMERRRGVYGAI